jgi:cardiolipin synthase
MTFWTVFYIVEFCWVIGFSLWLILQRRSPVATLAWILICAWLPIVGIAIYQFLGPPRLRRKKLRYAQARALVASSQAKLPVVEDVGRLMRMAERTGECPPMRARALQLYDNGQDTYAAIEAAVAAAEHHVHLEYYIWEADATGTRLRDLLAERARAGVEVRLLVDGLGSPRVKRQFVAPLLAAGVRVAWFNPVTFGALRSGLVNFRTHRKIVVCDGEVGFTGGINVTDVHTARVSGADAWRDTHARIEGAAVQGLQRLFLEDWNFATGEKDNLPAYFPAGSADGDYIVQVLGSGPDHKLFPIHKVYFAAIAAADRRVLITTPYFVPDEAVLMALTTAALRGVDVRLLVPRKGDSALVTAAARSYFEDLLAVGVKIYEYGPPMLHAKTMVIDDELSIVGTANMDNRSFRLNFECALAIAGEATAEQLTRMFHQDLRSATRVDSNAESKVPLRQRVLESVARLLSPIL